MPRWSLLLFAIVFAALTAVVLADGRDEPASRPEATPAPRDVPRPAGLAAHLRALQRIATEHGGTRAAGSPGDAATIDYVEQRLRAAGYRVSRERFAVPYFRESSPPRLTVGGRRVRPLRTHQFSASGTASGRLRAAGLGCEPGDFAALRRGEIALLERGTCFFRDKALNAQRAGAAAVLVVDQQASPVAASLQRPGVRIPVLGVGARAGESLAGRRATVTVDADSGRRRTANVVAESGPAGARVVMAGGHLDSVAAGPGLNDNGSGVAALLHVSERLAERDLPLRFAFWGAEEIGLVGSRRYVEGLAAAERRRIAAYVNLDMVGTPGAEHEVYDGAERIEAALRRGLPRGTGEVTLEGNSDHAPFEDAGIPVGGIFTGLDDCYHQRCDRLRNVDRRVLARSARATEGALVALSR